MSTQNLSRGKRSRTGRARGADTRGTPQRAGWVCDNCRAVTPVRRKRCGDCGTSRY